MEVLADKMKGLHCLSFAVIAHLVYFENEFILKLVYAWFLIVDCLPNFIHGVILFFV